MTIMNKKDLEFAYVVLAVLGKEKNDTDERKQYIANLKRNIREFQRRPVQEGTVIDDTIDGFTALFPLPENLSSNEEADEYFRQQEYIYYRNSAYDCTGQAFTSWYKIFERRGRFWAYHRVNFDV